MNKGEREAERTKGEENSNETKGRRSRIQKGRDAERPKEKVEEKQNGG